MGRPMFPDLMGWPVGTDGGGRGCTAAPWSLCRKIEVVVLREERIILWTHLVHAGAQLKKNTFES